MPETVGRYKIIRALGRGGMGQVFLAEDTSLGRRVALKLLEPGSGEEPDRVKRFMQEAKAASLLSHQSTVHIYEVGESEGIHFIAMEYVDGETLDSKIQRGFLQPADIVQAGLAITDALQEAHQRGIIHRDLKPSNIIIDRRGQVKVLDFGLAKILPVEGNEGGSPSTLLRTETGALMGTIHYMSPEQAVSKPVDARSDIFSLGVILYELATARRPFSASSPGATIDRILHADAEPITHHHYGFPGELERIISKCLRKEPAERYQSASDLHADLLALSHQLDIRPGSLAGERIATTEYHIPRNTARALFLALQLLYLGMYLAALRWNGEMTAALATIFGARAGNLLGMIYVATAMVGIAVRLYLLATVLFDHVQTGVRYRKIFPGLFLLDVAWSLAPFALWEKIGGLFALACIPPLVFSPFSQRTLLRSSYDLHASRRISTGK